MRSLRRVLRHPTHTDALNYFLRDLNDRITAALIVQCLDRIEKQKVTSQ